MKKNTTSLPFTQQELALLLGVSRSAVALYAAGSRSLPTAALIKLSELEIAAAKPSGKSRKTTAQVKEFNKLQQQKTERRLQQQAQKAEMERLRRERELEKLRFRHEGLVRKLVILQTLKEKTITGSRPKSLLEHIEQQTLRAMETCCPARQLWVEYRLLALQNNQKAALQLCSRKKG